MQRKGITTSNQASNLLLHDQVALASPQCPDTFLAIYDMGVTVLNNKNVNFLLVTEWEDRHLKIHIVETNTVFILIATHAL